MDASANAQLARSAHTAGLRGSATQTDSNTNATTRATRSYTAGLGRLGSKPTVASASAMDAVANDAPAAQPATNATAKLQRGQAHQQHQQHQQHRKHRRHPRGQGLGQGEKDEHPAHRLLPNLGTIRMTSLAMDIHEYCAFCWASGPRLQHFILQDCRKRTNKPDHDETIRDQPSARSHLISCVAAVCPDVKTISLSYCRNLHGVEDRDVQAMLAHAPGLEHLNVAMQMMYMDMDPTLHVLAKHAPKLTTLAMHGLWISNAAMLQLVRSCPSIHTLWLRNIARLSKHGLLHALQALKQQQLRSVNLSGTYAADKGVVETLLQTHGQTLSVLHLKETDFCFDLATLGMLSSHCSNLSNLVCDVCKITPPINTMVCGLWFVLKKLQHLDMSFEDESHVLTIPKLQGDDQEEYQGGGMVTKGGDSVSAPGSTATTTTTAKGTTTATTTTTTTGTGMGMAGTLGGVDEDVHASGAFRKEGDSSKVQFLAVPSFSAEFWSFHFWRGTKIFPVRQFCLCYVMVHSIEPPHARTHTSNRGCTVLQCVCVG